MKTALIALILILHVNVAQGQNRCADTFKLDLVKLRIEKLFRDTPALVAVRKVNWLPMPALYPWNQMASLSNFFELSVHSANQDSVHQIQMIAALTVPTEHIQEVRAAMESLPIEFIRTIRQIRINAYPMLLGIRSPLFPIVTRPDLTFASVPPTGSIVDIYPNFFSRERRFSASEIMLHEAAHTFWISRGGQLAQRGPEQSEAFSEDVVATWLAIKNHNLVYIPKRVQTLLLKN